MMRRDIGVLIAAAFLAHCAMNVYTMAGVFSSQTMRLYRGYRNVPPERRFFVNSVEEQAAIMRIRELTPEDARILWAYEFSPLVNCQVYPRRIYQQKEFKPGEDIIADGGFLKKYGITHVYVSPQEIYPVSLEGEKGGETG